MFSRSRLKKNKEVDSLYIKHIPLLVLAGICFFWLLWVFTTKFPNEIANILVHQLYLSLITPFFLFVLFLSGYLTLNMRQGAVIALFSTLLLLFRLQQIQVSLLWIIPFLFLFCVSLWMSKKNISQIQKS